ncbi:uncharacterized protein LOC109404914 [Aedes albopictus]|uniref:Secreted protein n=1 Tax=Aedes albopictus TaxID=7160 RepID=A0ABM2A3X1_AEDAL|nr:uncharacterized protein LOC109400576 [Aedes albopictus]XP_019533410.2 uncharacterized protein LOC109404914 [Aedes albopictus]XP_029734374.1 uncharacterized protein LOC115269686 [Aedes albopictus]KXJ74207.1 hypothetical protein RP20_CCG014186 [Aedes albopictus]
MNANSFRRIGYIYAVFCFICSVLGAVYFFKKILEPKSFCVEYFCESGFEHLLISAVSMVMCLLSATFAIFVKLGIEEGEAGYIHISRTFMLVRSLVLTIRWTYESVALAIAEITQDVTPLVEQFRTVATALLIVITASTGLELWILDGVQKYTMQRLHEETASNGSRS